MLQRCSNELNAPLHHFLQSCLPNSTLERVESDVRDEWPHLVVEAPSARSRDASRISDTSPSRPAPLLTPPTCQVASAAPDVVKYVVPQLSEVATMEEEAVRLKATHLLADLFESGQRVEHDYPALVTAFKGRLNDVSVEARAARRRQLALSDTLSRFHRFPSLPTPLALSPQPPLLHLPPPL